MEEIKVILVNPDDSERGVMEKMEAHRKAELHRAVSVFIFNTKGEWLLQRRAMDKYHSQGLWTNSCCTHPFPGEPASGAANRRLLEEMGLGCKLSHVFSFIYREKIDIELTEHELDHVFVGITDVIPEINRTEVQDWQYINFDDLQNDIMRNPGNYTVWFRKIFGRVYESVKQIKP